MIEDFFLQRGLRIRLVAFDEKEKSITLGTIHSVHSREVLLYHNELNEFLKEKGMPTIKKISLSASH